jgi:hypothetical protein
VRTVKRMVSKHDEEKGGEGKARSYSPLGTTEGNAEGRRGG